MNARGSKPTIKNPTDAQAAAAAADAAKFVQPKSGVVKAGYSRLTVDIPSDLKEVLDFLAQRQRRQLKLTVADLLSDHPDIARARAQLDALKKLEQEQ
ncbi:hypothetical protein [Nocardia sp. CC201C]|uniref:hypothetical protein n=1 Tax=Nocardia sp. CC201C TaxID=3044575 RepID=UPI0024A99728|nr:hypothetical protein [Nocardia sp. CC201C]